MGRDFYKILGVSRNATEQDIKKAYKKQALKWHPDRVPPDKKDEAQEKFQEIGEAFEVLTDPEKKRIYDQVGEDGLRPGGGDAGSPSGGFSGGNGTRFHFTTSGGRGAQDIFREFFGTSDPFAADDDESGGFGGTRFASFNMGGGGHTAMFQQACGRPQQQTAALKKSDPVNHTLYVSLEDLYTGTTKRMRITKKVIDASGQTMQVASEKEINIKPGWKDGTKITYEKEGDERYGYQPADIIFTIEAKKHDKFIREGDDLIYIHTITLIQALQGFQYTIVTLDNRRVTVNEGKVTPQSIKIIPGEGMPNSKKRTKGDLKVKYNIIFPELTDSQRYRIIDILQAANN